MRPLLALSLLLAACPDRSRNEARPDTDVLTERARVALKAAVPSATVTVTGEGTLVVKRGSIENTISLDNVRRACLTAEACDDALKVTVANTKRFFDEADKPKEALDRSKVRLTVKTDDYLADVDKMMKEKLPDKFDSNRMLRSALGGGLSIVYVVDSDTGMRMMQQGDLDTEKLTFDELDALAKKNLAAAFPKLTPMKEIIEGVYSNSEDENYASAMLVFPELWRPLEKQIGRPLVVAAPSRNRIFALSGADKLRVAALKKVLATALENEDHPLNDSLFVLGPKGFAAMDAKE